MTKRVYKYPLPVSENPTIDLPAGAKPLSVQVQGSVPCLWALVDPNAPVQPVRLRIAGTGHDIEDPDAWDYVGTFQVHGGALVFHLFVEAMKTVVS